MIELQKEQMSLITDLFAGFEDSMVISCLQGYMGSAYVKAIHNPSAALIISGEYSFFAGDANSEDAKYLVQNLFVENKSDSTVVIFDDNDSQWKSLLLSIPENNPVVVPRFGIVQKDYIFDNKILQGYIDALPEDFELARFDESIYHQGMGEEWSKEFCETFSSAKDYLTRGFGFAALKNGKLVSGASTMTVYDGGIEIQVATDEKYRGKGLAMACAAALIQECVKKGIRPCWDAANLISKKMALALGYEYKGEYITIHMERSQNK